MDDLHQDSKLKTTYFLNETQCSEVIFFSTELPIPTLMAIYVSSESKL